MTPTIQRVRISCKKHAEGHMIRMLVYGDVGIYARWYDCVGNLGTHYHLTHVPTGLNVAALDNKQLALQTARDLNGMFVAPRGGWRWGVYLAREEQEKNNRAREIAYQAQEQDYYEMVF